MTAALLKQLTMLLDILQSKKNAFCLLLSDAAKTALGAMQKSLIPRLFHVTCVAHFLHEYAMKVKSHLVELLISKSKTDINA